MNALQIEPKRAPPARPKPRVAAKPRTYPKARVIYDYNAQDNDELTLREQNIVDVRLFSDFVLVLMNLARLSARILPDGGASVFKESPSSSLEATWKKSKSRKKTSNQRRHRKNQHRVWLFNFQFTIFSNFQSFRFFLVKLLNYIPYSSIISFCAISPLFKIYIK